MYLSSLYGPVYLVSHIVIIYMMPELGLIIALEPGRKVRTSDDKALSRNKKAVHRFANQDDSTSRHPLKTREVCISDVQMKEYMNSALPLISLLSSYPNLALSLLLFVCFFCSFVLFPVLCVSSTCVRKHIHLQYMAY